MNQSLKRKQTQREEDLERQIRDFDASSLQEGYTVIDKNNSNQYQVREKLGQGGEGYSYRASSDQEDVVLKFVHLSGRSIADHEDKLRNLYLKVNEVFDTDYSVFRWGKDQLVLKGTYVEGRNLQEELVGRNRAYGQKEVVHFLESMIEGDLNTLHKEGYAHEDIKPANVIVKDSQYSLIDFGNLVDIDEMALLTLTSAINAQTLAYSRNPLKHDATDDYYSLAQTAYFMLTGKDPVFATDEDVQKGVTLDRLAKLGIDPKLKNVFIKMLGYAKKDYKSGDEILKDLGRVKGRLGSSEEEVMDLGSVQKLHKLKKRSEMPKELEARINGLKAIFEQEYDGMLDERKPLSADYCEDLEEVLGELGYQKVDSGIKDYKKKVFYRLHNDVERVDIFEIDGKDEKYFRFITASGGQERIEDVVNNTNPEAKNGWYEIPRLAMQFGVLPLGVGAGVTNMLY